ncbi:MAG: RNA polymerase factor sigma-54 [Cardiobacteriaceae bacterium]|nr:RNA polymerase factor sigma-54 [Cardiobacteriaceae bacterium]
MNYSQKLDLGLKQTLSLTPQLQQAIRLLSLNDLEIQHEISQFLENNFMLERDIERTEPADLDSKEQTQELDGQLDFANNDWQEEDFPEWERDPMPEDDDEKSRQIEYRPSLSTYLLEQIEQMPISDEARESALLILYHLEEDGYFRTELSALSRQYKISLKQLEDGLNCVQQCLPTGVGARDLEECILLQMNALPPRTPYLYTLRRIMNRHFAYIVKNPRLIKQALDLSDTAFAGAMALLRSFTPYPAEAFSQNTNYHVSPEIIVHEKHGISYLEPLRFDHHGLRVNQTYAELVKNSSGNERSLLQAQLQEARWFLSALDKRMETLYRVAEQIVAYQQEFFQEGETAMRPLTRGKVAEILGIHESTVSRAVLGKYLRCKRGVFELRYFFSAQLENEDGEDQSATAVKAMISEIISQENSEKPYSDIDIANILNERGYKIARRTIAKYREALNIPATAIRRKRI